MKKVHFIGIGGIGMSALARYYLSQGFSVSGSDNFKSEITDALQAEGILIFIDLDPKNIPHGVDKIIYTIAIPAENSELLKAKELEQNENVILMTYPQALGEMTNRKYVIAVCGTHGKTTTTAMAYYALKNAGMDISMIVGSLIEVDGKKTNYVASKNPESEWIVIEACEYRRSFLNYNPDIVLVTNIDNDHMDYFKDLEDTKNAFQEFVDRTKSPDPFKRGATSALVLHKNEDFLKVKNGIEKVICENFSNENEIDLQVPGRHNRKNAQLVIALGKVLNLDENKINEGLKNFKGTWRRQEYKGNFYGSEFFDDYAHHPTEIRATLQAFREKFHNKSNLKKIIVIFQPHLYSRTKLLFNDFVQAFSDADEVVLMPIYAAREIFDETISSEMLSAELNKIGKTSHVENTKNWKGFFENNLEKNSVVITMGAGSVYDIYKQIK